MHLDNYIEFKDFYREQAPLEKSYEILDLMKKSSWISLFSYHTLNNYLVRKKQKKFSYRRGIRIIRKE